MKITINIDCTPDEARRYMGLPDVAPMHVSSTIYLTEVGFYDGIAIVQPEKDGLVGYIDADGFVYIGRADQGIWRLPASGGEPEQVIVQIPPLVNRLDPDLPVDNLRTLEEHGIGRPSTYASIISTLQDREYVELEKKRFHPTDVGRVVNRADRPGVAGPLLEVEPHADLSRLNFVRVVLYRPLSEVAE